MKLYFVRHGETNWNKERRIQGQVNIELNEFGRHLARETAKGLQDIPFDVCFTSPLWRARETAELILAGREVPIIEKEKITEMAFGEYEGGCCSKAGWNLPEEFRRFFNDPANYLTPPGGENFYDMKKRTGKFLEELCQKEELKNSNVLITTHGAALAGLLNNIKKEDISKYWGVGVHKNCAVTEVEVKDGEFHIISENKAYYTDEVAPWEE